MKKTNALLIAFLLIFVLTSASACGANVITLAEYADALDFHTEAQLTYLLNTENPAALNSAIDGKSELSRPTAITLAWTASRECAEYTVEISENSDMSQAKTLYSSQTSVEVFNLKIATAYYWRVSEKVSGGAKSKIGSFLTDGNSPRNMFVDGVTNVRDMGGWLTANGRIAQGLLYRGARLNNSYPSGFSTDKSIRDKNCVYQAEITEAGKLVFSQDMKIKTEIDLRALNGNGFPQNEDGTENSFATVEGTRYVAIPMSGDANADGEKAQIKALFELLADVENYPIYFHCNIGTNRTGFVAYLVGALCGMSEDQLYRDYMFSDFGAIALPTPLSSNRVRAELNEITQTVDGVVGIDKLVKTYDGATLCDKTKNFLLDCGISAETYLAVASILMGN